MERTGRMQNRHLLRKTVSGPHDYHHIPKGARRKSESSDQTLRGPGGKSGVGIQKKGLIRPVSLNVESVREEAAQGEGRVKFKKIDEQQQRTIFIQGGEKTLSRGH